MTEDEFDEAKKAMENFRRVLQELKTKLAEHRKQITAAGVAAARRGRLALQVRQALPEEDSGLVLVTADAAHD